MLQHLTTRILPTIATIEEDLVMVNVGQIIIRDRMKNGETAKLATTKGMAEKTIGAVMIDVEVTQISKDVLPTEMVSKVIEDQVMVTILIEEKATSKNEEATETTLIVEAILTEGTVGTLMADQIVMTIVMALATMTIMRILDKGGGESLVSLNLRISITKDKLEILVSVKTTRSPILVTTDLHKEVLEKIPMITPKNDL